MKKILVIVFSVILGLSASAQKVFVHPVRPIGPRVIYYRPYSYYGYLYYGFNYSWYYGQPAYYHYRPTKLEMQVQDIENEYSDRIKSVRADDSLTHHDRKEKIRDLRHERDQAIDDAKKSYYKQYED